MPNYKIKAYIPPYYSTNLCPMSALTERFHQKLHERKTQGNLRSLRYTQGLQDFCSNDYLGLARDSTLQARIHEQLAHQAQPLLGATGSRLVSGHHAYVERVTPASVRGQGSLLHKNIISNTMMSKTWRAKYNKPKARYL